MLDGQLCDECHGVQSDGKPAPFFCGSMTCLKYYCEHCWATVHSMPNWQNHRPLLKDVGDHVRFHWCPYLDPICGEREIKFVIYVFTSSTGFVSASCELMGQCILHMWAFWSAQVFQQCQALYIRTLYFMPFFFSFLTICILHQLCNFLLFGT